MKERRGGVNPYMAVMREERMRERRGEKRRGGVNPYVAVVLGLRRRCAARGGHRGGAVGRVLLWRAGVVQTILWWGVSWASRALPGFQCRRRGLEMHCEISGG